MMTVAAAAMKLDRMAPEDWPAVRTIYLEGILGGQATFEESVPAWEEWDEAHLKICRLVARAEDRSVAGWAALRPCRRGHAIGEWRK